jgi:hypothetical protein
MSRPALYTKEENILRRRASSIKWANKNKEIVKINSIKWAKANPDKVKTNIIKHLNKHRNTEKRRLNNIWYLMVDRCYNPKYKRWDRYGGRGIAICDLWLNNKNEFIKWGSDNGYKIGLSIDRINNNGNYEPNNCKFSTPKEQIKNRSNTRFVEYGGEIKTISEWAEIKNIPYDRLWARIKHGSIGDDLFRGVQIKRKRLLLTTI